MPKYTSATSALRKCLILWQWLEQHPRARKNEAYDTLGLKFDLCLCPACQYARDALEQVKPDYQNEYERCAFCPLYPEDSKCCEDEGEPYAVWANGSKLTEGAHSMCELISKRLTALTKEQEQ